MVLYRDLFALPADHHPYATFDATAADVQKLTVEECRAFHKRFYVPKNAFVVIAGDTTPEAAKMAAEKAFGAMRTAASRPLMAYPDPYAARGRLKVTLVDRPKSSQSDVYVGELGPLRSDPGWANFAVSNQVIG